MRAIGGDDVVDYTCDDISRAGRHFDLIVDTTGRGSLSKLRRTLTSQGRLVIVGADTSHRWIGGTD